ncbi:endo-glucanase, partial [Geosmithia morbida]
MKITSTIAAAIVGMASIASAHMEMKDPPPLRSKYNDFTTDADYSMTNPLSADGSDFPCKGYQSLMGTPQGKSVKTYQPGQSYKFTITGSAVHNGGSCQASLSYDEGKTWSVIHSYIGKCPVAGDSDWDFTVPEDAPSGEALFAWTWFNEVGNREMYMNCASVTIGGGSSSRKRTSRIQAAEYVDALVSSRAGGLSGRPAMFVANVGNGCTAPEGGDVEFPDPGPDVTRQTAKGETVAPEGSSCGSSSEATSVVQNPSTPTTTLQTVVKPTASPTQASPSPSPTPTAGSGAQAVGSPCDQEGQWNCVGGSKFQRCASGMWSAMLDMSAGSTCQAGMGDSLVYA